MGLLFHSKAPLGCWLLLLVVDSIPLHPGRSRGLVSPFPARPPFQSSELSWRSMGFRFVFLVFCGGHGWKAASFLQTMQPKSHSTLARPQGPLASSLSLSDTTRRGLLPTVVETCAVVVDQSMKSTEKKNTSHGSAGLSRSCICWQLVGSLQ